MLANDLGLTTRASHGPLTASIEQLNNFGDNDRFIAATLMQEAFAFWGREISNLFVKLLHPAPRHAVHSLSTTTSIGLCHTRLVQSTAQTKIWISYLRYLRAAFNGQFASTLTRDTSLAPAIFWKLL